MEEEVAYQRHSILLPRMQERGKKEKFHNSFTPFTKSTFPEQEKRVKDDREVRQSFLFDRVKPLC